jgi:hypothetical protein
MTSPTLLQHYSFIKNTTPLLLRLLYGYEKQQDLLGIFYQSESKMKRNSQTTPHFSLIPVILLLFD